MKARGFVVGLALLALVWMLCAGCATNRFFERTIEGATIGAGTGYAIAREPGAIVGGLIGGGLGGIWGTKEKDEGKTLKRHQPVPLPWIKDERTYVFVQGWSNWGESLRATIEEGLRARGAVIVATPGRQYSSYQPPTSVNYFYLAEVYVERAGQHISVQIRIIKKDGEVKAIGKGACLVGYWGTFSYGAGYGTYYDEFGSFVEAAHKAITTLH